jgi:hypothetical protein
VELTKGTKGTLTVALAAVAVALVIVPLAVDQPFGAQTADTMRLAYALRRWSPIATAVAAIVTIALAAGLARRARWWVRALWTIPVVVTLGAAWLAWHNPFEWMFNPLARPGFVPAAQATFVEHGDLVLAVTLDGDAAAYPIRQLAYHHVVNDRIGRTPAVVTY